MEGYSETITVCQTVKRGKETQETITQYRACDAINISNFVNNFSSTTPILSSLVSEF